MWKSIEELLTQNNKLNLRHRSKSLEESTLQSQYNHLGSNVLLSGLCGPQINKSTQRDCSRSLSANSKGFAHTEICNKYILSKRRSLLPTERVNKPINHNYKLFHQQHQLSHKSVIEATLKTFHFLSNWLGKTNRHPKLHEDINYKVRRIFSHFNTPLLSALTVLDKQTDISSVHILQELQYNQYWRSSFLLGKNIFYCYILSI